MATDYFKLAVKAVYSKNSDYSGPKATFSPDPVTLTPDEYLHFEVNCDDNGEIVTTDMFSGGVTLIAIQNNDTAIAVTAQFDTAGDVNVDVVIPAGGILVTPDFVYTGNLTLTSASGTPECEVLIVGT
jgi:hypothetical protein|tara:strand:+ start:940 stop:1323 length:384 start_codon:yes stop_codon:yes gene_type:complete